MTFFQCIIIGKKKSKKTDSYY